MNQFTEGKIFPQLIRFIIPVLGAMFLQTMYGAVDLLIVGQFSTSISVSGVSTGSWLLQLVTSFIVGIAMGPTVLLGMYIGEKKEKEAGKIIGTSIVLFSVLAFLITILMEIFAYQILEIMNTPTEAFLETLSYYRICMGGCIFVIFYNLLGSIFKGMGNSKMPLITVTIACICNIIGDLFLVGKLSMGAAGAAYATVFAQGISVLLSVFIISRTTLPFQFSIKDITWNTSIVNRIFQIGFPLALQDVLVTISFLVITAIVNQMGVIASAGVGIAEKLCGFIMLVPSSFSQTMASFVSQNYGAKQHSRSNKALMIGIACSLFVGVFVGYFTFFHGDLLSSLFANDKQVVYASWQYLKAYAIDCLLTAELFCFIGYFNGCSQTMFVMVQGMIGAFGVRIPVSYCISKLPTATIFKLGLATPCSTIVQILLCGAYFIYFQKKLKKNNV